MECHIPNITTQNPDPTSQVVVFDFKNGNYTKTITGLPKAHEVILKWNDDIV